MSVLNLWSHFRVRYLLDTNMFIAAMKGAIPVRQRLSQTPLNALILSPIVLGELQVGVAKSNAPIKNAERLQSVIAHLELVPLDAKVSTHYATIRAELERRGTPIGANDFWIAAQALALGVIVVTDNENEFKRVPGLRVENWLRAER